MTKVMQKLHEKQQERAKAETQEGLKKQANALFKTNDYPSVGPKDADVTVVEFFDYHCGYCKRMIPTITQLLKQDKKVRVIFRDFPILSDDSTLAAKAALAVHKVAPAKYFEYHQMLMKMSGKFDEKNLTEAAKKLGVDAKKFKTAMDSPEVNAMIEANQEMAGEIGVRGTPAMIFPDRLVPGAVPLDDLQRLIDNQRTGEK
ncbi:MAG: DsbA family protein [Alphaproteobacteria bacterium]|nr:DsbA family protein [Alphaproteobacteria bacterium]